VEASGSWLVSKAGIDLLKSVAAKALLAIHSIIDDAMRKSKLMEQQLFWNWMY
jgi:hypothetical protein